MQKLDKTRVQTKFGPVFYLNTLLISVGMAVAQENPFPSKWSIPNKTNCKWLLITD